MTNSEISLLSKGLSFVPSVPLSKESTRKSLDAFDRSNRIRHFFKDQPERKPHPFKSPSKWIPPKACKVVESYLQRVRSEINKLYLNKHIAHNLTPQEIEALKNLAQDTNLIIKKADKGSGIVLEDKEKYIKNTFQTNL